MTPARMKWQNGILMPVGRTAYATLSDAMEDGKIYDIEIVQERSQKSHGHFFASLSEAFSNLPELHRLDIPSIEHLRKRALIHTGWAHTFKIPCASGRAMNDLWKLMRETDEYVVCLPDPKTHVLTVYKARSMSKKEMRPKEFQQCKDDVLKWAWGLVGMEPPDQKTLAHA